MPTPKPQRKYNHSEKGKQARRRYDKANRRWLDIVRGDRTGLCSVCGQTRWLVRKSPPTCRTCHRKEKID